MTSTPPSPALLCDTPHPRGFSLLELLAVMCIMSIVTVLAVPAVRGIAAANLSTGINRSVGALAQARSEAAVLRTPCRFAVVTGWPGNPHAEYRAYSLWRMDASDPLRWSQITNWDYLPEGAIFDPAQPASSPAGIVGAAEYLFSSATGNSFSQSIAEQSVEMKFVEFLPTGATRIPGQDGTVSLWFRITEGQRNEGEVAARTMPDGASLNYADVMIDGLIGRIKTARP